MTLKLVIHAPTQGAVARARSNARNLLRARPDAEIRIVVNADGIDAIRTASDDDTDALVTVCRNSLERKGVAAPGHVRVTPVAVLLIAELQAEGWSYMRA